MIPTGVWEDDVQTKALILQRYHILQFMHKTSQQLPWDCGGYKLCLLAAFLQDAVGKFTPIKAPWMS